VKIKLTNSQQSKRN